MTLVDRAATLEAVCGRSSRPGGIQNTLPVPQKLAGCFAIPEACSSGDFRQSDTMRQSVL